MDELSAAERVALQRWVDEHPGLGYRMAGLEACLNTAEALWTERSRLLSALGAETAAREAAEAREAGLREVANVLLVACEATLEGFDSCSQLTNSFPVLREIVSKARAALEAADEGGEGG